jgi:hypothetical protein
VILSAQVHGTVTGAGPIQLVDELSNPLQIALGRLSSNESIVYGSHCRRMRRWIEQQAATPQAS